VGDVTNTKIGIASYEEMKARTMAVVRGERRVAADEPLVWFTSEESAGKVLGQPGLLERMMAPGDERSSRRSDWTS
jgi:predicted transcriptional regulator